MNVKRILFALALLAFAAGVPQGAIAQSDAYRLNPGDVLDISIWREDTMRRQVLVLPDGTISYPLAGHLKVAGMTPRELEAELKRRLVEGKFYRDPALTVSVTEAKGNKIFVTGRVRTPGTYVATQPLTVMQGLSLAGGLADFADERRIVVLRTAPNGKQKRIPFDYSKVHSDGPGLANFMLRNGDVIVVPESSLF